MDTCVTVIVNIPLTTVDPLTGLTWYQKTAYIHEQLILNALKSCRNNEPFSMMFM